MLGLIALSVADGATGLSKVIHSRNVTDRLESGQPAEFDNCTIVGDLNLSALNIEGPVHFNHTLFQNSVNFNSTTFNSIAYFYGSKFNGDAHFERSKFNSTAYFYGSKFNSTADFMYSKFTSDAYFGNSHFSGRGGIFFVSSKFNGGVEFTLSNFNGGSYFGDSKFNGGVDFADSKFNGGVDFGNSKFNGGADFWDSNFSNYTYFYGSKFNSTADFQRSKFNSTAYFGDSKFNNYAYFVGSKFNSTVFFEGSKFNSTAYFGDSKFNSDASFEGSKFNTEASFVRSKFNGTADFVSSQFSKDAIFLGARLKILDLSLAKYERLYLRWSSTDIFFYDDNYGDTTYQLLMENFKNLGFSSDFDNCYYQFRVEQFLHRNYLGDPLGSLLDFGALIFYGFGKRPLYPLVWAIVIVLLFGAFWRAIEARGKEDLTDKYSSARDQITYVHSRRSGMWDKVHFILKPFVLSTTIFLSGTKLFVESPEVPESPRLSRSFIKGMFTFERILGAFFSILLILAISGTIVR